jgi:hypothetical protein
MLKQVLTSLLAIVWFSVANHCVVSTAFASPVKPAHHCGQERPTAPVNPHDHCTKQICCEVFSPMTSVGVDVTPHQVILALPSFTATAIDLIGSGPVVTRWLAEPLAAGPPYALLSLLGSLTLAQNAPPPSRRAA